MLPSNRRSTGFPTLHQTYPAAFCGGWQLRFSSYTSFQIRRVQKVEDPNPHSNYRRQGMYPTHTMSAVAFLSCSRASLNLVPLCTTVHVFRIRLATTPRPPEHRTICTYSVRSGAVARRALGVSGLGSAGNTEKIRRITLRGQSQY